MGVLESAAFRLVFGSIGVGGCRGRGQFATLPVATMRLLMRARVLVRAVGENGLVVGVRLLLVDGVEQRRRAARYRFARTNERIVILDRLWLRLLRLLVVRIGLMLRYFLARIRRKQTAASAGCSAADVELVERIPVDAKVQFNVQYTASRIFINGRFTNLKFKCIYLNVYLNQHNI